MGSLHKVVESRCEALLVVLRFVRSCDEADDIEEGILRPAPTSLLHCEVEVEVEVEVEDREKEMIMVVRASWGGRAIAAARGLCFDSLTGDCGPC